VPLFDLKFLEELAAAWCRNFKSAALASSPQRLPIRARKTIP